jgi:hypothetical protein
MSPSCRPLENRPEAKPIAQSPGLSMRAASPCDDLCGPRDVLSKADKPRPDAGIRSRGVIDSNRNFWRQSRGFRIAGRLAASPERSDRERMRRFSCPDQSAGKKERGNKDEQ